MPLHTISIFRQAIASLQDHNSKLKHYIASLQDHDSKLKHHIVSLQDHDSKLKHHIARLRGYKTILGIGVSVMRIKDLSIERMRNEVHFQFHTGFVELVEKFTTEALKIQPIYKEYLPPYKEEGLTNTNKGTLMHFDEAAQAFKGYEWLGQL